MKVTLKGAGGESVTGGGSGTDRRKEKCEKGKGEMRKGEW